jgi:hypothetical protein
MACSSRLVVVIVIIILSRRQIGSQAREYFAKIYTNFDKQESPELNGSSLSRAKRWHIACGFGEEKLCRASIFILRPRKTTSRTTVARSLIL